MPPYFRTNVLVVQLSKSDSNDAVVATTVAVCKLQPFIVAVRGANGDSNNKCGNKVAAADRIKVNHS